MPYVPTDRPTSSTTIVKVEIQKWTSTKCNDEDCQPLIQRVLASQVKRDFKTNFLKLRAHRKPQQVYESIR